MADVNIERDKRIYDEKWKVVISGLFMFFLALVVMCFFSSTFEFGDNVIRYFLSTTTGSNWWRPCERCRFHGSPTPSPALHRASPPQGIFFPVHTHDSLPLSLLLC